MINQILILVQGFYKIKPEPKPFNCLRIEIKTEPTYVIKAFTIDADHFGYQSILMELSSLAQVYIHIHSIMCLISFQKIEKMCLINF